MGVGILYGADPLSVEALLTLRIKISDLDFALGFGH